MLCSYAMVSLLSWKEPQLAKRKSLDVSFAIKLSFDSVIRSALINVVGGLCGLIGVNSGVNVLALCRYYCYNHRLVLYLLFYYFLKIDLAHFFSFGISFSHFLQFFCYITFKELLKTTC